MRRMEDGLDYVHWCESPSAAFELQKFTREALAAFLSDAGIASKYAFDRRHRGARLEVANPIEPGAQVTETYQTMLIAMAMEGFGFDPNKERNEAVGKIERAIANRGMELTAETIRLHLRAAAKAVLPRGSGNS